MNLYRTKRSETTEQIRVIQWAKHHESEYPMLKWLIHIPNGGRRDRKEAAVLRQMGVKSGVSDLFLPFPAYSHIDKFSNHGLFIEMKYGDNKVSRDQQQFLNDMEENGYYVAVCYSYNQAVKVLEGYITSTISKPNNSIWKDEISGQ